MASSSSNIQPFAPTYSTSSSSGAFTSHSSSVGSSNQSSSKTFTAKPELFRQADQSSLSSSGSSLPSEKDAQQYDSALDKTSEQQIQHFSSVIPKPSSSVSLSSDVTSAVIPLPLPGVSQQRMQNAMQIRQEYTQLNQEYTQLHAEYTQLNGLKGHLSNSNTKPENGLLAKLEHLQIQLDQLQIPLNQLQTQLIQLKQDMIAEIVTPQIRDLPNDFNKAKLVFERFMERGRNMYDYHPSPLMDHPYPCPPLEEGVQPDWAPKIDLLAGDTRASCGNISTALKTCLKEAGFSSEQVNGSLQFDAGNKNIIFLTKALDPDFIDPKAQGNIRDSTGAPVTRYLFARHFVTEIEEVGFFCPTTGKHATTLDGLREQLVEQSFRTGHGSYQLSEHSSLQWQDQDAYYLLQDSRSTT